MNATETSFKRYCDKKKYFCRKLQTHTATGEGTKQVSDFIVCNNEGVYFIECKERKERFSIKDLTQYADMLLLRKRSNCVHIMVLLNFYVKGGVYMFTLEEYLDFINYTTFKSGKQKLSLTAKDIPDKYKYSFKQLKI